MFAHRISYHLKLKGPSFVVDTACSSSGNALYSAFQAMRKGECENAIVGGCNLTLHPGPTMQFCGYVIIRKSFIDPTSFNKGDLTMKI